MDLLQAINERHSVRRYTEKEIPEDIIEKIKQEIKSCNEKSGLNFCIVTDEDKAFDSSAAHYGHFSGVRNYIALISNNSGKQNEKLGYYGERLALFIQTLGLNTCWVAMTYGRSVTRKLVNLNKGESIVCVLTFGYGVDSGKERTSKNMNELCRLNADMPEWFENGMKCAMKAPTAMNQQKFVFILDGDKVKAEAKPGFYTKTDLGIAKYHFEIGAGRKCFDL